MRLAVSGNGYSTATTHLLEANQLAAITAQHLMSALDHTGAMAGHTAATWAATYDYVAQHALATLVDLVDALANTGRMSQATGRNHATAEARATLSRGSVAVHDDPPPPTYSRATLRMPPTAAGTRGAQIPHWAAWILNQVEGFIWPDSDTDRLHAAAHAWRTASHQLDTVKAHCLDAATAIEQEIAPDVQLAADATRTLATHIDSLAQTLHSIARSCDDLADQVHDHRTKVLDIVTDTVRDAVIVEGIGIVLGAVTGGITAAAATSVNTARIAAIAPRIIRILDTLRIAIGASETGARLAADTVIETRTGLQAFLRARLILTDRGCAMPFYWYEAAKDGTRLLRRAPGWLLANETPGHVLEFHVGKSDSWLLARIAKEGKKFASSFTDTRTAEDSIEAALHHNPERIDRWLASNEFKLEIDHATPTVLGRTCDATGGCVDKFGLRVVLFRDADSPHGYYVRTAFPR